MEDQIKRAFEAQKMGNECSNRIWTVLHSEPPHNRSKHIKFRLAATAICLIAFVILLCNPTVVQALEDTVERIYIMSKNWDGPGMLHYKIRKAKFHITFEYDEAGNMTRVHGSNNLEVEPDWLIQQDDRLYFTGNGEYKDITDLISMEEPFTYTFTDNANITHFICIGGLFDPDPEKSNVGYGEWFYDSVSTDKDGNIFGWIGGYADNYWNKETDSGWLWFEKAKDALGIPWM